MTGETKPVHQFGGSILVTRGCAAAHSEMVARTSHARRRFGFSTVAPRDEVCEIPAAMVVELCRWGNTALVWRLTAKRSTVAGDFCALSALAAIGLKE